MAPLTKQLFNSATPDFTRRSAGIRAERPVLPRTIPAGLGRVDLADRSFGGVEDIFGIAGDIVGPAATVVDQAITNRIKSEATEQVDTIRDEFGVGDAATTQAGIDSTVVPEEITRAAGDLDKLTQAYRQGKLKNSSYWARLESVSRQLRTRFPGHRDQVDSIISRLTGGVPANQVRRALLQESVATTPGEKAAKRRTQLQTQLGRFVTPQTEIDFAEGRKSEAEFTFEANRRRRELENINFLRSKVEVDKKLGEKNKQNEIDAATAHVSTFVKHSLEDGNMLNNFEAAVADLQTQLRTTGQITGKDQEQAIELFNNLSSEVRSGMEEIFRTAYPGMDEAEKTKIRGGIERMLAGIGRGFELKDINLAAANTRMLDAAVSNGKFELMQEPFIARMNALRSVVGETTFQNVWINNIQGLPQLQLQLKNIILGKSLDGTVSSLDGAARELSANNISNRQAFRRIENDFKTLVLADDVEEQMTFRAANVIYGDKNLKYLESLDDNEKIRAFLNLTSEDMTDRVLTLSEKDPRLYDQYLKWSANSFKTLLGAQGASTGADVQEGIAIREGLDIELTADGTQFRVTPRPRTQVGGALVRALEGGFERQAENTAIQAVNTVNNALRNLTRIMRSSTDPDLRNTRVGIPALIRSIGITPGVVKQPNLFRKFLQAARRLQPQLQVTDEERQRVQDAGRELDALLLTEEEEVFTGG